MEGSIEKFNNLDTEVNEISELELADKIEDNRKKRRQSGEAYQLEIKSELIDLFEENYFDTMNKIEDLSRNISDEKLREEFGFDMDKLREYADGYYPYIMERINILSNKGDINIIGDNSFRDVLSNSFFNGMTNVKWFRENFAKRDANVIIDKKISDPKSGRRKNLDNFSRLLNSEDLEYYAKELCSSDGKLKTEIEVEQGYISRFSDFFKENERGKIYPSGSKKLSYFRFFSEAEKWKEGKGNEIKDKTDFIKSLANLDPNNEFIIKDKIRNSYLKK